MRKLGKIIDKLTFYVALVSYVGLVAIMLLNVADVLMSKFAKTNVPGAYEITEIMLLCTVMTAFAYGQSTKSHINMTMMLKFFPRKLGLFFYGLMGILSTFAAGAVGYAAILQAQSAFSKNMITAVVKIPFFPFFWVEAIAMLIFALVLLYDTVFAFAAIGNKEYREEFTQNWI